MTTTPSPNSHFLALAILYSRWFYTRGYVHGTTPPSARFAELFFKAIDSALLGK